MGQDFFEEIALLGRTEQDNASSTDNIFGA
jgi:hypothetical protein